MSAVRKEYAERASETVHDVANDLVSLLRQADETLGIAESHTGGSIMATITAVTEAGAVFRGGGVTYTTPLKERLLDVDSAIIAEYGVIHQDVAKQMAMGARKLVAVNGEPATWGIGTTGVAGPGSQDEKPVGMAFIGIASGDNAWGLGPFHFAGDRQQVRHATVMEALTQLRRIVRASRSET